MLVIKLAHGDSCKQRAGYSKYHQSYSPCVLRLQITTTSADIYRQLTGANLSTEMKLDHSVVYRARK